MAIAGSLHLHIACGGCATNTTVIYTALRSTTQGLVHSFEHEISNVAIIFAGVIWMQTARSPIHLQNDFTARASLDDCIHREYVQAPEYFCSGVGPQSPPVRHPM